MRRFARRGGVPLWKVYVRFAEWYPDAYAALFVGLTTFALLLDPGSGAWRTATGVGRIAPEWASTIWLGLIGIGCLTLLGGIVARQPVCAAWSSAMVSICLAVNGMVLTSQRGWPAALAAGAYLSCSIYMSARVLPLARGEASEVDLSRLPRRY